MAVRTVVAAWRRTLPMQDRFHQTQYFVAAVLALAFGLLYAFCPEPRSDLIGGMTAACVGFVIGKFSNGFKKGGEPRKE